jgi:hypothetical protein
MSETLFSLGVNCLQVRRSALKVLSAVISSRPEMLKELYSRIANDLIGRFKVRLMS